MTSGRRARYCVLFGIAAIGAAVLSGASCAGNFYRYDLDKLSRKARKRIEEIDRKMAREERKEELENILAGLEDRFERAEALYKEEKYDEAYELYREIGEFSRDEGLRKLLGAKE